MSADSFIFLLLFLQLKSNIFLQGSTGPIGPIGLPGLPGEGIQGEKVSMSPVIYSELVFVIVPQTYIYYSSIFKNTFSIFLVWSWMLLLSFCWQIFPLWGNKRIIITSRTLVAELLYKYYISCCFDLIYPTSTFIKNHFLPENTSVRMF